MAGLLYPAYHKFYNALRHLERFDKEADFFDNVACLDAFFSEYRNVTFAVQSQLKHTEYWGLYERYRDEFLRDHWFVEKRNETTKQAPFRLVKRVKLTVYSPSQELMVDEREFTVDDDVPLDSLFHELEGFFSTIPSPEVFFSASFSFVERGGDVELLERLPAGILSMRGFMAAMDEGVGESCAQCDELKSRIEGIVSRVTLPSDFLFVNDYVYHKYIGQFEKATKFLMRGHLGGKMVERRPLADLTEAKHFRLDGTPFGTFALMHAAMIGMSPGMDLMPAILTIYDGTYDLDVFHATIKTTMYRKINEAARRIAEGGVREVCLMALYNVFQLAEGLPTCPRLRALFPTDEILVVSSIDHLLREKEYVFDAHMLSAPECILATLKAGPGESLRASRLNMQPIRRAFAKGVTKGKSERHTQDESVNAD